MSADGVIHVEYNHVDQGVEDLIQQTRAIETTLDNLEAELNELKTTWQGADAQAYGTAQADWNNAVIAMEQLLTSHATLLGEVSNNYRQTENSLAQMWSELS
ncbi:WXG100 family type VII secretion target [Streptomyces heilongjiangensis]|uniref:ESAT-6-like protein n=1 Tax=Streptomyces heilongjiangensis TaxID=945052 RepID=A0ABW1BCV2_9ACTN|nr:WXG100 family type VII secretion target [Streptomyces heilongjiangensis]MDC2950520.1 WXG100 family type VII secretion target [Streptomyces heilongjiangensis]